MKTTNRLVLASAIGAVLALAGPALSQTPVTGQPPVTVQNGTFEAVVSADQLSRLSVMGDRVVSVRSLQDPGGPQMLVEAEEATGDVYVGFDGDVLGRTFSLFLVTASGRTIQGNLVASGAGGQTVLISTGSEPVQGVSVDRTDRRSDYQETVTAMVRVLFRGEAPEGVRCQDRGEGARREVGPYTMRLVRTCDAAGLRGQEIHIQNKSDATAPVLVDTFLVAGVMAAASDRDELQPGATARILLVEEAR